MAITRHHIFFAIFIFLSCWMLHHRLPSHPWTYDDLDHIEAAQKAQSDWTEIFSPQAKEPTRWVLNTYFYFAYKIFGENPAGYHTVKIILHATNALLFSYLILTLFKQPLLAKLSGFLFLFHCASYEALYKISATGLLIGTLTTLLSLLLTKRYCETTHSPYAMGAGILYALTLLSYEPLISMCVPALYLWWRHAPHSKFFSLTYILPLITFFLLDTTFYATANNKVTFNALSLGPHIFTNFGFFVARLFLNAYTTPFGWGGPPPFDVDLVYLNDYAFMGWAMAFTLIALSLKSPTIQFATLWLFATIAPCILSANNFYFPRYWYMPSMGSSLLVAMFFTKLYHQLIFPKIHKSMILSLILLLIVYLSYSKTHHYEGRFVTDTANFYLTHKKDPRKAISLYTQAENQYHIEHALLYHHKAIAYDQISEYETAQTAIIKAIKKRPDFAKSYLLLSEIAYKRQDFETAIQATLFAIQLNTSHIQDLHQLGNRLKADGHLDKALLAYQHIIENVQTYPHLHLCHFEIGEILYQQKRYTEAINQLSNLLNTHPNFIPAKNLLQKIQNHMP